MTTCVSPFYRLFKLFTYCLQPLTSVVRSPLVDSGTQTLKSTSSIPPPVPFGVQPPPLSAIEIVFPYYELTQKQEARNYYHDIRKHVEEANGTDRYAVRESKHSILIKDGNDIIYKCSKYGVAPRCLLLELFDRDYMIPAWIAKRERGEYYGYDYHGKQSPPQEKI